jgi:hypothetical protein
MKPIFELMVLKDFRTRWWTSDFPNEIIAEIIIKLDTLLTIGSIKHFEEMLKEVEEINKNIEEEFFKKERRDLGIFMDEESPCEEPICLEIWDSTPRKKDHFHCDCHTIAYQGESCYCEQCKKWICEKCTRSIEETGVNIFIDVDSDDGDVICIRCLDKINKRF